LFQGSVVAQLGVVVAEHPSPRSRAALHCFAMPTSLDSRQHEPRQWLRALQTQEAIDEDM
jgi:hypothetical protein